MDQWYLHANTVFAGGGTQRSPVSFPKRSNPAWRLVTPSAPCRINTKGKHQIWVPS